MNPRRPGSSEVHGRGSMRGGSRPRSARQINDRDTGDSRLAQLLHLILTEETEASFAWRISQANQVFNSLNEMRTSGQYRQDPSTLLQACLYRHSVQWLFHSGTPNQLKRSLSKIFALLGCLSRTDLLFSWLCDQLNHWSDDADPKAAKEIDWKIWLLHTLKQAIIDSAIDQQYFQEAMPLVIKNMLAFLDTMDTQDCLPILLDTFEVVASQYKEEFHAHFKDFIDLLVGWHIDSALAESKRLIIEASYRKYKPFWRRRLGFAFELLRELLTDLPRFLQELQSGPNRKGNDAFAPVLRCYLDILQVVLPLFPKDNQDLAWSTLCSDTLDLLSEARRTVPEKSMSTKSNQIVIFLNSLNVPSLRNQQWKIYQFFASEQTSENTEVAPMKLVGDLMKIVNMWIPGIDPSVTSHLLDTNSSPLFILRKTPKNGKKLDSAILAFVRILIRYCDENTRASVSQQWTSNFYKMFGRAEDTSQNEQRTALVLLSEYLEVENVELQQSNSSKRGTLLSTMAEAQELQFYSYILLDSASVWTLIRKQHVEAVLKLVCLAWSYKHDTLFDDIIQLLGAFYASCSMKSDEALLITCLLHDALNHWVEINLKSRQALCGLTEKMLKELASVDYKESQKLVQVLLQAAECERDSAVTGTIIRLVVQYSEEYGLGSITPWALNCLELCIHHPSPSVQKLSQRLLSALSPFTIAIKRELPNLTTMRTLQSSIMATPHTGSFRPAHYEIVMRVLGMASYLISSKEAVHSVSAEDEKALSGWTRRVFHHCDALGTMKNIPIFEELRGEMSMSRITQYINNYTHLTAYWAVWESARYCMLSRLRTPFGGPQPTFAAFEHMLNNLISETKELDKSTLDRLRYLLLFLDRLELQIYNASDGCATNILPPAPRSSLVFFRTKTNKKTCQDYFARIRPNMILGAKRIYSDHFLIRHTLEALSQSEALIPVKACADPLLWFQSVNEYLKDLVEACIRQKHVDLINGLQSWYKRVIKKVSRAVPTFSDEWRFEGLLGPLSNKEGSSPDEPTLTPWFQIAAMFAFGQHEDAISALQRSYTPAVHDSFGILDMLNKQVLNFYTSLESYDSIKNLCRTKKHLFSDTVVDALTAFTDGIESASQHASKEIQSFMSSAPLDLSLQLGRLDRFHSWVGDVENTNELLKQRATLSLEDGLLSNRANMFDYQFLQRTDKTFILDATSWYETRLRHRHPILETNYWNRLATRLESTEESNIDAVQYLVNVQLEASKVARKQKNLATSVRWLEKATKYPAFTNEVLFERVKILLAQSNLSAAMGTLNSLLVNIQDQERFEKLESEAFLKIARLLKSATKCSNADQAPSLLSQLEPQLLQCKPTAMAELQSPVERAIDAAFQISVEKASVSAKPWFEYATHHYKQGWRILDDISRSESTLPVIRWARQNISALFAQRPEISDPIGLEKDVLKLLQQSSGVVGSRQLKEDEYFNRALEHLLDSTDETLRESLLEILDALQSSIIARFRMSAEAYFSYLCFDHQSDQAPLDEDSKSPRSTSMLVTTTLRLLRLLVKYGGALCDLYTEKVNQIPIEPWKSIIPQLFSKLNHPAELVRRIISQLLLRICDHYPREIIYDIIVSSTSSKTNGDTKQALDMIANRIVSNSGTLWASTRRMAEELEKITVLWEEKWLNRIASLQFDVMQQFSKLDREIVRIKQAEWTDEHREQAFCETYINVMKFVVSSVEKVLAVTIYSGANTPHEQWFVSTFGKQIGHAFELLQKPESIKSYRKGWDCFQQLHRVLVKETQKVRILGLDQVSPFLAESRTTTIGIPGIQDNKVPCFIDAFGSNVIVLPTKTKPKKLDLRGTDGKKYSYLFKGLEDLHLDERIMQLLSTTNGLLAEDRATAERKLKARTYAVIPLSDHSGMIQWVDDATPLFALYKRWQKRENAAQILLAENPNEPPESLTRPAEGFFEKIATVLKAEGLRVSANRRHWPKKVLSKVFSDLVKETPPNLIAKELWCSSVDTADWLTKTVRFSRSLAVMSMLGYIIGLGDRHLDNMMVDYRTGDIIHIDYNVCFEKGKRLRVPETVPYRLTQNLHHALGITGVDGVFRTAAEETLRVLRKHKEVLITLLDAFVYDPLVDWENETGEAEERRMMELQANLTLVATRLNDQKSQYEEQQQGIGKMFVELKTQLQDAYQSAIADQAVDEGSDDDYEEDSKERNVEKAKEHLLTIRDNCRTWSQKHRETLAMMRGANFEATLDSFKTLSKDIQRIPTDNSQQTSHFKERLSSWISQRESVFSQCFEELRTYSDLLRPIDVQRLADQDICSALVEMLGPLVEQDFSRTEIEAIQIKLQQPECSPALQNMESRAVGFLNHVSQFMHNVETLLEAASKETRQKETLAQELLTTSTPSSLAEALLHNLSSLEIAFQKNTGDDFGSAEEPTDMSSVLTKEQALLERRCHFGCFSQQYNFEGLIYFTNQLAELVPFLQHLDRLDSEDFKAFTLLSTGAKAIYTLEDACLSLCGIVFDKVQPPTDYVGELLNELERANLEKRIMKSNDAKECSEKANELFETLQSPFKALYDICKLAKETEYNDVFDDAHTTTESFLQLKQSVITNILQEAIKQCKAEPPDAWVPPNVRLWSITFNSIIAQSLNTAISAFVAAIHLPLAVHTVMDLREKMVEFQGHLRERGHRRETSEDDEKTTLMLQTHLEEKSRIAVIREAESIKKRYEQERYPHHQDAARFQWYNASLVQSSRPLIRSELFAQMSNSQESVHRVRASLRSLGDLLTRSSGGNQTAEGRNAASLWKEAFDDEMRKCDTLMKIYTTVDHFENFRKGNSRSAILQKEVEENLNVMNTATNDSTVNPGTLLTSVHVPLSIMQNANEGLSRTGNILKELESHVDGISPLLESVVIIEMDADSELKPAQESAKSALELMAKIKSLLQTVADDCQQEKTNRSTTWTFARLLDVLTTLEKDIQELYRHLRTLDSFGQDSRMNEDTKGGSSGKPSSSDPEEETINPKEDDPNHEADQHAFASDASSIDIDLNHVEGAKADAQDTYLTAATTGDEKRLPQATATPMPRHNKHVLGIMRRVRHKLEGHDFGVQHTMSVAEQVAKTIEQAMLPENLCVMYEGWTSWI